MRRYLPDTLHTRRRAMGTAALASVLWCAPASAQLEAAQDSPDRWNAALDLALTGTSGNQSFVVFTAGSRVQHLETERYELEWNGQVRYGRSDGDDIARKAHADLKFDLHPEARWSPFLFVRGEHDAIRSLDLRLQGGAGAKYSFRSDETSELSLSLAVLYDRENVAAQPVSTTGRWSWRTKGVVPLGEAVELQQITFYQPVLDDPGDFILTARSGLSTRITEHLALTVTHQYERDSTPPPEVRPADQTVDVGLRLEF